MHPHFDNSHVSVRIFSTCVGVHPRDHINNVKMKRQSRARARSRERGVTDCTVVPQAGRGTLQGFESKHKEHKTTTTTKYVQDVFVSHPPTALKRHSRNAAHTFISLEERNNRFLFGITTVISRLTSQLPWPGHTAIMSVTTTLAALSTVSLLALHHETPRTLTGTVLFQPEQTSTAPCCG